MKLFVTVTLLVSIFACCESLTLSEKEQNSLKEKFGTCKTKHSLNQQQLQAFFSSNFNNMDNDGTAKCFVQCMMEQTKYLENGRINSEKIREKAAERLGNSVVQQLLTCQYTPQPGCDDEYQVYKCFIEKAPQLKQLLQGLPSLLGSQK